MAYMTHDDIDTAIRKEMGMEQEEFVSAPEMIGYHNEALRKAQSIICRLYEDYFLKSSTITLVNGTSEYDLPSDIYVSKIRKIMYVKNSYIYPVRRLRGEFKLNDIEHINEFGDTNLYTYYLRNDSAAAGVKLVLAPASYEDGTYIKIWYIRDINVIAGDSDISDTPEFMDYIMEFMRLKCRIKEHDQIAINASMASLNDLKVDMKETLVEKVPDYDNLIPPDRTFYDEMA